MPSTVRTLVRSTTPDASGAWVASGFGLEGIVALITSV